MKEDIIAMLDLLDERCIEIVYYFVGGMAKG